ncbi:hypothetical protein Tco_0855920 [Tanacetum coccineum]
MYLTSSRPDIIFVVCARARYQVNLKVSHLHAMKRIFRYLKGQPKLGLWYPKDSPFDLVAYTDSDYAGASLDRKSTTRAQISILKMMRKVNAARHNLYNAENVNAIEDSGFSECKLYKGRKIHDIDADEDITLENVHDADVFGVHDLDGNEVFIETEKHVVNAATTTSTIPVSTAKDLSDVDILIAQGTGRIKEPKPKLLQFEEHLKIKKKDQVLFDEQEAIRLQAQFDKEERIAREKEKANVVLTAQWNDIQDKVETDYELAQRLRKFFAAKRVEEKRNKQPTKAQQRSIMTTYLKNMAGWKPKYLKTKSFANVQELFDKAMKMVNTFVDMDTELMEGSETREESGSKRAGGELEQEPSKKQKVDDDKESEEFKQCMEIISDDGDDVTIEATPLSTKSPTIVDYKIYKEGKKSYFQIIRADVHCVTMQNILYYLLVEKMYPLTKHTLHQMSHDVKLQVEYEVCTWHFELLRWSRNSFKEGYINIKFRGGLLGLKAFIKLLLLRYDTTAVYITTASNVSTARLVLLVQKLLLLVLKVNAAGIKVTTAERLQLLKG